jgi:sortase (surface protein transpeptidase)
MATHQNHTAGATYFERLPVSAIVLNQMLTERLAGMPLLERLQRFSASALTAFLLTVSVLGFYQMATLVSPAHHRADSSAATPAPVVKPAVQTSPSLPRSIPTTVSLPSIGVNANVVSVGQNSDGSIEVPGPNDVGWYNLGPTPGEIGPAIMVGHVDYVTTGAAVFWNLRNMQPGDTLKVARQDGKTVAFKVEKVESYGQDNFPTQEVYGNISYAGLRLITCTGDFNYLTHHYSDNLVVYARAQL